jgi:hypothetical protein
MKGMKADMKRWLKNGWRLIANPYSFFEEMINRRTSRPATGVFIVLLILENLGWTLTIPDYSAWLGGFLLPLVTYPAAVLCIFLICRILVRENRLSSFFSVWGFSYIPTFLFFFLTIVCHGLQRFTFLTNIPNSLLFTGLWTFIFLMFLWKLLFLAITLRLAGNLNLKQIIIAVILISCLVLAYWWVGIRFDLMKVPYI